MHECNYACTVVVVWVVFVVVVVIISGCVALYNSIKRVKLHQVFIASLAAVLCTRHVVVCADGKLQGIAAS